MFNLTRWMPAALALCGLAAFGCSGSPGTEATTASNASSDDLSDSALALRSTDNHATFQAVGRCKRGRGHEDADGGVDESGEGRMRGPKPHGGQPNLDNGLDQLLAAADLTELEKCQTLAKDCVAMTDRTMCEQQVADCVRPVIEAAFKAICEARATDCAQNMDDPSCKHAVGTCTDMGAMPGSMGHQGGEPGVRRGPPSGAGQHPRR